MSLFRRTASVLLPLSLFVGVAACGSDKAATPATTAAAPTTNAAPVTVPVAATDGASPATDAATTTPAAATTTPAAACDGGNPFVVGSILTLSGPAAATGQAISEGVEVATAQINEEGGVLGRCVKVISKDDANDPTKAAQVTSELVDQDKVDVVYGPATSGPQGTSIEVTREAGVLQWVSGIGPIDWTKYPYVFRLQLASSFFGDHVIKYAKAQGWKSIGVLAVNNALGTSASDALKASAAAAGITITDTEIHESGAVDMTPQIGKIKDTNPDGLMILSLGGDAATALKARQELAWDIPTVGFLSIGLTDVVNAVGPAGMHNVFGSQNFLELTREAGSDLPRGKAAQAFYARFQKFKGGGEVPSIQSPILSYDSLMMMAKAVNAVGSVNPSEVKKYLETNGYDGAGASYTYADGDHNGVGLDDVGLVVAASLHNGTYELAPNQ
ncbi:MAG: ABC transporter substrate-binding protein [Ilumatobacteraceae bacterium]